MTGGAGVREREGGAGLGWNGLKWPVRREMKWAGGKFRPKRLLGILIALLF